MAGWVGVAEVVDAAVAVGLRAEEGGEAADQVGVPGVPFRAHGGTAEEMTWAMGPLGVGRGEDGGSRGERNRFYTRCKFLGCGLIVQPSSIKEGVKMGGDSHPHTHISSRKVNNSKVTVGGTHTHTGTERAAHPSEWWLGAPAASCSWRSASRQSQWRTSRILDPRARRGGAVG